MIVELMTCRDDINKVYKSPVLVASYECTLKASTNVVDPVLILTHNMNAITTNYCYIPEFGRYYFIRDIVSVKNGLWEVTCHCDVLNTYKAKLMELDAIVRRQQYNYDLMLSDSKILHKANPATQELKFPRGFLDEGTGYALVMLGNYSNTAPPHPTQQ